MSERPPTLMGLPSYLAGHLARIARRGLSDELARHDLRLPHFALLSGLADFGTLAQHELADRCGLNRSHVVGFLDTLEGQGLVRRERDGTDRRRLLVALTDEGQHLFRRLEQVARRSQDEGLEVLDEPERAALAEMMRRVLRADDARAEPVE